MEENLKKKSNTKKIILGSIIGILIGSLISVSYAFFTYNRTGLNNKLIVGDIYMRYKETSQSINFTNAMPSNTYVANQYFEFDIIGKNTNTTKDIIYDIVLAYGDNHETRTTRIRDNLLKFRLVTVNNDVETEIFNNQSYDSINNKRIHATTIPKNTTTESTTTYRLYAWISNDVRIGNVEQDYTESEWNDVYASIKVNVTGDFTEKAVARPINQVITTTTKDTGIKFYEVNGTDNGNGLYLRSGTENDPYPIYYYRGNVDNNNVYFAENCWKIVRTTSTGGLKLVYNGAATIVDGEKQCLETTGTGTKLSGGMKAFNSSSLSPAYVGYALPATSSRYAYSSNKLGSGIYYGSSVNQTTYELEDPQTTLDSTHHYSYNSTDEHATGISGDTGNVRYYYCKISTTGYFIKFDKTKSVSTILNEMLSESNSKNNPSTIQGVINTWWGTGDNSLNSKYGEYLEDTEWCNDRSVASLGGWDPNGGLLTNFLDFTSYVRYDQEDFGSDANNIRNTNTPILTCSRPVDRLTVANGNLTYPIGLLTYDEVAMAGARWSNENSNFYLYTGEYYWLLSPSTFINNAAGVGYVYSRGGLDNYNVDNSGGVRPALSLKSGTQILRGEGTKTKPYIITEQ